MKIIVYIFTLLIIQSCNIYNETKQIDSNICKLLNEKMRKTIVGTKYGNKCSGNKDNYPNVRTKICMGCVKDFGTNCQIAVIYHCKTCNKIKKYKRRQKLFNIINGT